jgi:hypothetical protein
VAVEVSGRPMGALHIVELELLAEADDDGTLSAAAEALAALPGLTADPRSKLEHALRLIDDASAG